MSDELAKKMHHIDVLPGEVGRYVLLPGDPFRTDLIASFFENPQLIAHKREHKTWIGTLHGKRVAVTSTGMGCPSAAIAIEELIRAGADTFIRIGTAGRVNEASKSKELDGVICTAAVRDEGTTIHYVPIEYPAVADRHLVDALAKAVKKNGKNYIEGIAQTKDSYYGQHEPFNMPNEDRLVSRWKAWERSNVVCSEMESAALFVVASIKGARAASIMSFRNMEETIQIVCDALKTIMAMDDEVNAR
ncbi:MAG: uridine phosphorylase [Firmicutes bacterium HGW-Firmicutes-20]|jgi:uridine phosphorylase|nr:MAG: uridine phosphorylase [Firmicutes bacterium HGW-Firmicutes-20]